MNNNIKDGTNSEDKVNESITDKDTNIQSEGEDKVSESITDKDTNIQSEGEDKVSESITDKDTNIQSEGLDSEIPINDNNTRSINSEKTIRKSNSNTKIEDYDLIVNSLRDATISFKDVILSLGKKAQEIRDKAEETFTVGARRDARDIQALGGYIENVIKGFEDTMAEIKKRNYHDEEKLLRGYKKLLEEQINLINARTQLVKRLKSTQPNADNKTL